MDLNKLKSPPVVLAAGAIVAVLCVDFVSRLSPRLDLVPRLEWITYDWRMRQAQRIHREAATNLAFVHIGDETIDVFSRGDFGKDLTFGLYWPRHIYGRLVHELVAQRAKVIGLDVLFAERRIDHGPQSDAFLAAQIQRASNVVLGATHEVVPDTLFRNRALALGGITIDRDSDGVLRRVKAFHDVRIWHDEIKRAARLANLDLEAAQISSNQIVFMARDGKRTTIPLNVDGYFDPSDLSGEKSAQGFSRLYRPFETTRLWHLGILVGALEVGADLSKAQIDRARGRIVLPLAGGGNRVLPINDKGELLIDWTLGLHDPRLTLEAFESLIGKGVLRSHGSNVTSRFEGKLVFVGSTALGNELSDRGATPLEKDTFLTSSHWNVANSVITGRFIRVPSRALDVVLACLMGFAGSVFACKLSTARASVSVGSLAAIYIFAAVSAQALAGWWFPLVTPLFSLAAGYVALLTYQNFFEESEKRRVKDIFSRLVAPSVVKELLEAKNLSLIGKRRRVTVLFTDIRGFTEMTDRSHARAEDHVFREQLESMDAEKAFDQESQEVLKTVNLYLSAIADTIKRHGGTLDKYIGDCAMAFWGAPGDHERPAAACVQAAIEAQRAVRRLNEERREENARRERANFEFMALGQHSARQRMLDVLSIGTGINTGTVDAGLMGSDDTQQNYTVFGRDVNVASRLEKLAGSGRILIGEATFRELQKQEPDLAAACIELPPTEVRGIREAIRIYEVPWK